MSRFFHWLGRLIGAIFLLWTVIAAGSLWRFLLLGEDEAPLGMAVVLVFGGLSAWFLAWLWYRQPQEDRRYVQRTLLKMLAALLVAVTLSLWRHDDPMFQSVRQWITADSAFNTPSHPVSIRKIP